MSAYCEAADLYDYGLPRGSVPNPGRLVSSVAVVANTLELEGHGLRLHHAVTLRAEAGGTLPAPLVAATTYYAIPTTESVFQLSATVGGAAIDLTTAGDRVMLIVPLPIAQTIVKAAALIEDMLPAHVVPLAGPPFPPIITSINADLAAHMLLGYSGGNSVSLSDKVVAAQRTLERWAKGVPIRGDGSPARANLAVRAAPTSNDPRGWTPEGGDCLP